MKRRILSLMLTLGLLVGLLPVMMAAAEPTASTKPTETTTKATVATKPTTKPTVAPTTKPTTAPTTEPTTAPTTKPTTAPTTKPTTPPTTKPTAPTTVPTLPATVPTQPVKPPAGAVSVSVKLCETEAVNRYAATLTAYKGGPAVYAITDAAGWPVPVTDGTVPGDHYIKLEYAKDDIPTITLKGAYLRAYGEAVELSGFDIAVKIVVETDSCIESAAKRGILRKAHGDLIITGSGKLTMRCYSSIISFDGEYNANSLSLLGITMDAYTEKSSGRVFHIPAGNLVIDRCTLNLTNQNGIVAFVEQGSVADASTRGNVTITNSTVKAFGKRTAFEISRNVVISNSAVQIKSEERALSVGGNCTVDNMTQLVLENDSSTLHAVSVAGRFALDNSIMEIIAAKRSVLTNTTKLTLISNMEVLAGSDKHTLTDYVADYDGEYHYLIAAPVGTLTTEPSTEPTVPDTDPTSEPTIAPSEVPTTAPTTVPTSEPTAVPTTEATWNYPAETLPTVSIQSESESSGNSMLLWILAGVMVLGACSAAAVAIMMIRNTRREEQNEQTEEKESE